MSTSTSSSSSGAQQIADVVSVQNRYNFGDRGSEECSRPASEQELAFIPWFPLEARTPASPARPLDRASPARTTPRPVQVALAWLLRPLAGDPADPGHRSVAHLEENLEAAQLELTQEDLDALEP